MVFGCIRKSKHKGIQELSACSTASWCHCTGESASFKKLPFLRLLDKMFQRMLRSLVMRLIWMSKSKPP